MILTYASRCEHNFLPSAFPLFSLLISAELLAIQAPPLPQSPKASFEIINEGPWSVSLLSSYSKTGAEMYIVVDRRDGLGTVIREVRFLPKRWVKCERGTAAKQAFGVQQGRIPVCSRNEWRYGLRGGQIVWSESHA